MAVAPAAPLAQTPAAPAPSYSPAAYAQPVYAPAPAPATPTVMSPASMAPAPVVISAAESRPVDPELASSARRVATVFSVLALVVLILGIVSGLLVAAGGFLGESVTGTALLTPAAGLLSGVSTILTAVVLWAFWKLLALVARYIALRAE
ncbi:unannotated protein [freshwater metagenome]|uniref:Unannotated protein n=1 Tax=freshwater metagenome TaxID=449393 RepID=A0A6J7ITX6_9ZZZZ